MAWDWVDRNYRKPPEDGSEIIALEKYSNGGYGQTVRAKYVNARDLAQLEGGPPEDYEAGFYALENTEKGIGDEAVFSHWMPMPKLPRNDEKPRYALELYQKHVELVRTGLKTQAIIPRTYDNRPELHVGDVIDIFGPGSNFYLGAAEITQVKRIELLAVTMELNGKLVPSYGDDFTDEDFAKSEGHESFTDMSEFYRRKGCSMFSGIVIYWEKVE